MMRVGGPPVDEARIPDGFSIQGHPLPIDLVYKATLDVPTATMLTLILALI